RRPSHLAALGDDPVPDHPPGRGSRRRPERDGQRAAPAPAADHLRPARRRRDLRVGRHPRRAAVARGGPRDLRVLLRARPARALDRDRSRASRRGGRAAAPAGAGRSRSGAGAGGGGGRRRAAASGPAVTPAGVTASLAFGSLPWGELCFPHGPPSSRGRPYWGNLPVLLGPLPPPIGPVGP